MNHNSTKSVINEFSSTKLCNRVKHFFDTYKVAAAAGRSNIKKEAGISSMSILYQMFLTPFFNERLTGLWKKGLVPADLKGSGKDAYYRFISNHRYNWRRFINLLSLQIICRLEKLSLWQDRVLILDDTTQSKRGKKIELVSWVFDSVAKKSTLGFKNLVLGWSDGLSFIPFDFTLVASSNRPNSLERPLDKRTIGARRRKDASRSKMALALEMIQKASMSGLDASFVLFDSWFAFPSFIKDVYDSGYNVICKLKNLPNIRYTYKGKLYNLDTLYRKVAKDILRPLPTLPGRYASIDVTTKDGLHVRIVFYLDGKGRGWSAFLCTDLHTEPEKVLTTYARRWPIEPFFKVCKQNLHLGKEQCRNFDSIFASTALAILRYLFLSITTRFEKDPRTLGELFKSVQVEMNNLSTAQIVLELIAEEASRVSST
ncbi:MAG: transposase, partial [Desulfuromonadales bacterium]|nr:transposase [Desulfuromonadales bacterium]